MPIKRTSIRTSMVGAFGLSDSEFWTLADTNFRFVPGYMDRFKLLLDAANRLGQDLAFLFFEKYTIINKSIVDAAGVDPGDEMPIIGTCRLCHMNTDLQVSHFLPNAVYARLREHALKNPHPVLMSEDDSIISSKQIAEHLLCFDCEQRFSKLDESWVLGNMARATNFPLQDMLIKANPLGISPDQTFACYSAAAIPSIDGGISKE